MFHNAIPSFITLRVNGVSRAKNTFGTRIKGEMSIPRDNDKSYSLPEISSFLFTNSEPLYLSGIRISKSTSESCRASPLACEPYRIADASGAADFKTCLILDKTLSANFIIMLIYCFKCKDNKFFLHILFECRKLFVVLQSQTAVQRPRSGMKCGGSAKSFGNQQFQTLRYIHI